MKSLISKNTKLNSKGNVRLNRRAITFLFCLLISIFIWLLMSLSKEYTISLSFPVKYINLPADKLIANHLPETIDIDIRSKGFSLLIYKVRQHRETVLIDINDAKSTRFKNKYYINCNDRLDKITGQFNSSIHVERINPDTVFINYNKKIVKQVPVKANLIIDFEEQFQQTDSISIEPKFIDVSGTAEDLTKIKFVETIPVNLKKVNKNLSLKLELVSPLTSKQIEYSQNFVFAKVNITKFTEAAVELPILVEKLPSGLNLKTFPDKISVKYQVAFNDYGKINPSDFRVVVDYSKIEAGSNKLKVLLVKSPKNVRSIKLSNEKVEYIIRK